MPVDDRLINVRIDQLLTRRGVNTQKLQVSTHTGVVTITGTLASRSKRSEIGNSSDMKRLDQEVRHTPNVKDVHWHLDNWKREEGQWSKLKPGESHGHAVSSS